LLGALEEGCRHLWHDSAALACGLHVDGLQAEAGEAAVALQLDILQVVQKAAAMDKQAKGVRLMLGRNTRTA
jgi:hypothetical protein